VRAAGVSYSIHSFPVGYSGAVPVRYYLLDSDLAAAMSKLKLSAAAQSRILNDLKSGKDHIIQTEPLSDDVAADFGWPAG
jgi:hypothetical protein